MDDPPREPDPNPARPRPGAPEGAGAPAGPGAGAAPPALSGERLKIRSALELGAAVLGVFCVLDCAREALSGGAWRSYADAYTPYRYVLAAYSGTREWEKWTDPAADAPRIGHVFIYLWLGLGAALLWMNWSNHYPPIFWPTHYNETLLWVLGCYAGTAASRGLRKSGLRLGAAAPKAPAPAGAPAGGSPAPAPAPDIGKIVARACWDMKVFTPEDVAKAAALGIDAAHGYIGRLAARRLIKKEAMGRFRWIGPPPD